MLIISVRSNSYAVSKSKVDSLVLERIFTYKESLNHFQSDSLSFVYVRYNMEVEKRNPILLCVPSMYVIAKGNREYAGETYTELKFDDGKIKSSKRIINIGTVPRYRTTMPSMTQYMSPRIYDVSMVNNYMLSPFNRHNRRFYKYRISRLTGNRAEVIFIPKLSNTQLVNGRAIVEYATGRVIKVLLNGEFDMTRLRLNIRMGTDGVRSLHPQDMSVNAIFSFLGNKISANYRTVYNLDRQLPDSIVNNHDRSAMDSVRPEPLPPIEKAIYEKYDLQSAADTTATKAVKKRSAWKAVLWDAIGDNIVNRIQGNFGSQDQGSLRISPILNPLYMGYSKNKGITYKFNVRTKYNFNTSQNISLNFKGGYSFKQKQFYFMLPLQYTFNAKKNGFLKIEFGNGNRITNSSIVDVIKHTALDSIKWDEMKLDYFKDLYLKVTTNYDLSDKVSIQPGLAFHRRSAVDKRSFELLSEPSVYRSFAPTLQLQYRPFGWNGVTITSDYERGIKGIGQASMNYERFEFDASWICRFSSVRLLSLRCGSGFYTSRSHDAYFLDYSNFRDNNLLGGWNDDWSGDFHLLDRNWYNVSKYYIRTNTTYESPLLFISYLPFFGRFIETERLYISTLNVEHLHPYIEYGYGFTNRLFSVGIFCATRNVKFDGFGVKFGFELFSKW